MEYELPAIQRKNQEQERFSITVRKMEDAYDEIEKLYHSLKERYAESDKRSSFLSRENERMKSSMKDLTKQVNSVFHVLFERFCEEFHTHSRIYRRRRTPIYHVLILMK